MQERIDLGRMGKRGRLKPKLSDTPYLQRLLPLLFPGYQPATRDGIGAVGIVGIDACIRCQSAKFGRLRSH